MKKFKLFANRIVALILAVTFFLPMLSLVSFADEDKTPFFEGLSSGVSLNDLYNQTNTYKYNGDNPYTDYGSDEYRRYEYYNVSSNGKISTNTVSGSAPQITVLTHGLNSDASTWGNKFDTDENGEEKAYFAIHNNLLIDRLYDNASSLSATGAKVYWAVMADSTHFKLYELEYSQNDAKNVDADSGICKKAVSVKQLSEDDASKHLIIVFESNVANGYNNQVYEGFNYMLSKIIYDVKYYNNGILPKVNLIGHSRGGITNLQYALDHPDLVDSIFSMGTPYFGTDSGSTSLGAELTGHANGLKDIIDRNIYMRYYERWNNNPRIYGNISVHAMGGFSTVDLFVLSLLTSKEAENVHPVYKVLLWLAKECIEATGAPLTAPLIGTLIDIVVPNKYQDSEILAWAHILQDLIPVGFFPALNSDIMLLNAIIGQVFALNDVLVDLPSQLGYDFHGGTGSNYKFNKNVKFFTRLSDNLAMPDSPAVVHNMEPQDADFIDYIIGNIDAGGQNELDQYHYITLENDEIELNRLVGTISNEEWSIPGEIDGKKVVTLSSLSSNRSSSVKKIIIPATVKTINSYCFSRLSNLQEIEFEPGSQLTTIGKYAFANCQNLTSVIIPASVTSIDDSAFANCSNLNTVVFANSNRAVSIGKYAFDRCKALTTLSVQRPLTGAYSNAFWETNIQNVLLAEHVSTDVVSSLSSQCDATAYTASPENFGVLQTGKDRYSVIAGNCSFSEDRSYLISFEKSSANTTDMNATMFQPMRNGYIFGGWTTSEGGTTPEYTCENVSSAPNTTLYAIWIAYNFSETDDGRGYSVSIDNASSVTGEITIPSYHNGKPVLEIGENFMKGFSGITKIVLPGKIETIGNGAFTNCANLDTVVISKSSTGMSGNAGFITIGEDTFDDCSLFLHFIVPDESTMKACKKLACWSQYQHHIFTEKQMLEEGQYVYFHATTTAVSFFYTPVNDDFHHYFDTSDENVKITLRDYVSNDEIDSDEGNLYNQVLKNDRPYIVEVSTTNQTQKMVSLKSKIFSPAAYENLSHTVVVTDFDLENWDDLDWLFYDKTYWNLYLPVYQAVYDNVENLDADFVREVVIKEHMGSSLIFLLKNSNLMSGAYYDSGYALQASMAAGEISTVIIRTENNVIMYSNPSDYPEGISFSSARDPYSLGVNIAQTYLDYFITEMSYTLISAGIEYLPVIAPYQYRNNTLFLLGMSHVLNYPVKVFSTPEELEEIAVSMREHDIYDCSLMFVDVEALFDYGEDMTLLEMLEEYGYDASEMY
ncbi:MAG: leucine-rich repeat protein, partial [Ruminococcus flavefaciens]|nr:leucine-rich repeat protein [Ruminococcus flavefaciens]